MMQQGAQPGAPTSMKGASIDDHDNRDCSAGFYGASLTHGMEHMIF